MLPPAWVDGEEGLREDGAGWVEGFVNRAVAVGVTPSPWGCGLSCCTFPRTAQQWAAGEPCQGLEANGVEEEVAEGDEGRGLVDGVQARPDTN